MASKALQNLKYKITGQKYHNNLLGESLEDMLRIATAKTLEAPDATLNQQVVDTINQEIASGRDPKDIVNLLNARLRMDNPQKQFLAVKLVEQVMSDCSHSGVLGPFQQELLQDVARVMARPAKPETDAGKRSRQAAKELLRKYGQQGTTAFRAVHHEGLPQTRLPAGYPHYPGAPTPYPVHSYALPPGTAGAPGSYPPGYPTHPGVAYGTPAGPGMSVEKQSIIDEVRQLIDKARSNSDLLCDMLVNTTGAPDDFEAELIKDLVTEVRELREVFNAYLEQIGSMEGPEMDALVVQALEAVDMLDGALALQKDVALNQQEFAAATQPRASSSTVPAAAAAAAPVALPASDGPSSPPGAGAAPAAAAPKTTNDLIALDELAEAMTAAVNVTPGASPGGAPAAVAGAASYDPFAASDMYQATSPPAAAASSQAAAAPSGQPTKSAFESMFAQPGGSQAYASLASVAPSAYPSTPDYPYGQQYGQPAPAPVPQYGHPYGMPAHQEQLQQQQPFGGMQGMQPPMPYYPGQQPGHAFQPQSSNPFVGNGYGAMHDPSAAGSAYPGGPVAGARHPFGGAVPAQGPMAGAQGAHPAAAPTVDQEWDLFFADRTAGTGAAQAPKPVGPGVQ